MTSGLRPRLFIMFYRTALLFMVLFFTALSAEAAIDPEPRRRTQWPVEPAHLFVPLPYSMPGIGEGFFFMAYFSNLFNTTADAAVVKTAGDAQGTVVQLDEIPLIDERLHLTLLSMDINKASMRDYASRGMGSDARFNLLTMEGVRQNSAQLTLSFWERRLALRAEYGTEHNEVGAISDQQGNLLVTFAQPQVNDGETKRLGLRLDLTDDYLDPRRGLSFDLRLTDRAASSPDGPDYYVIDYSLLYYMPFNSVDTLALNYFRSDAQVRRMGQTNPAIVAASLGSSCAPSDNACLQAETQHVQNVVNANRYGSATALGGTDRLRSYSTGRFSGAHMQFVGAEYRANFIRDAVPFDYFIWKDVHTSIQLALFAELGTVAETEKSLWLDTRQSYGAGVRLLSASGSVYRADYAKGDEGVEFSVFFFYPWR